MNASDEANDPEYDEEHQPQPRSIRGWAPPTRWWPLVAAVAAVAVAVSLLFPAGRHQWALSLFRQPTRYTALSFRYAWLLPASGINGKTYPLFFTIRNQEGRSVNYRYIIRETDQLGLSQTLGKDHKTIQSGGAWLVDTKVTPTCGVSPCRVQVILPGYPERIFFLISLKPIGT